MEFVGTESFGAINHDKRLSNNNISEIANNAVGNVSIL